MFGASLLLYIYLISNSISGVNSESQLKLESINGNPESNENLNQSMNFLFTNFCYITIYVEFIQLIIHPDSLYILLLSLLYVHP